ncbi:hypothetical protein OROMI_027317 [Orobanche minor]
MDNENKNTRNLPSEIIEEEILTRVSVKSALRLRCVSKSWCSLIDNKHFINKHSQNSTRRCRVIANIKFKEDIHSSFLHCSYLGDDKSSASEDRSPIDNPREVDDIHPLMLGILVGQCNGLLCIWEIVEECFILWNPATRISVKLAKIVHDKDKKSKYGFGWDEQSGAYKVFVCDLEDGKSVAKVYSSKTNSWTSVERGCDSLTNGVGVFAYGRIQWMTTSGYIECFDLKSDVFETRMIKQPFKPALKGLCVWLWESRGRLCIVCDSSRHTRRRVWVMVMNKNKNKNKEEFNWVEDEEETSQLDNKNIYGCHGAFSYFETLVSPALLS